MELKFSRVKEGKNNVLQFHFEIITDTMRYDGDNKPYPIILYFHTYEDLSGFTPNYDITDPREFITLGQEILFNKDYIRNKIVEAKKQFKAYKNKRPTIGTRKFFSKEK
jgi:hypothetical protein